MKKIIILLAFLLFLGGCGKAKLIDGKEAIVTFDNKKVEGITAEDLYDALKETYGVNYLIDMIDTTLLEKEYKKDDNEKTYINQVISSMKEYAEQNSVDYLDYIKSTYGVSDEKGFKEYITLNYRRNLYTEDYAKTLVTDKQIEDYYEKYSIGDIKAFHILITSDAAQNATDEEKKTAEETAKKKAEDLIKELDNGADFKELAKKNSKDSASAVNGGELDYFNRGEMDKAFEDAAVELEVGKYSKTPVKSAYGYHIIYKTEQKDKPSLKDAKEGIIETISKELLEANSSSIYLEAMQNLREKYKMNIVDSDLKGSYEDYLTKLGKQ